MILGVLRSGICVIVATYFVVHPLSGRSHAIARRPEGELVLIPISIVVIRLVGETLSAVIDPVVGQCGEGTEFTVSSSEWQVWSSAF